MVCIIAEIVSLVQYVNGLKEKSATFRLKKCLCCGKANPWHHGAYPRKADRENTGDKSLNPLSIQRFFCRYCRHTCSVLPECIPPHRWYLWDIQQIAFALFLSGKSLRAMAKQIMPSRRTIHRWVARFKERFLLQKDVLCSHFSDLGRKSCFADFWQACFATASLGSIMRLCHVAGVPVP